MKRLFPWAIPTAVAGLSLFVLVSEGCAPTSDVKPGAPVLAKMSLLSPTGSIIDVVPGTTTCVGFKAVADAGAAPDAAADAGAQGGTDAGASDAGAGPDATASDDGSATDATDASPTAPTGTAVEGGDCDPSQDGVCLLGGAVCHCDAKDMCDPSIDMANPTSGGTLVCHFPPMTVVRATFDRLLNTAPFEAMTTVATLASVPTTNATPATDYTSSGSQTGLFFTVFFGITGPSIAMTGTPALPSDSTLTFSLDKGTVRAKDGTTPFTGDPPLKDGIITYMTSAFTVAGISVPQPPPPPMTTAPPMMGCSGAAPVDTDAGTDAGESADASDAGAPVPTPTDVQMDMEKGPITISFTNPVDKDVVPHIKLAEGATTLVLDTDYVVDPMQSFPNASVTLLPKTVWAAGKTYTVSVDDQVVDVLGKKVDGPATASFTRNAK
jgi:Bacterial Ig-like domain